MEPPVPALIRVEASNQRLARYCATFNDGTITHFGRKALQYYIDHFDMRKRSDYLQRHKGEPAWDDPTSPQALERWLLWECNTLAQGVALYNKRFRPSPPYRQPLSPGERDPLSAGLCGRPTTPVECGQ